jgi:formate hydrogenlyase subunit 3/multisubunit Na+/H+ antiporter MnhD subunit
LASFDAHGKRIGFYPAAMLMYAGLIMLVRATSTFEFFAAWEFLTVGSYFLILRGKKSEPHALSYIVFSSGWCIFDSGRVCAGSRRRATL